MTKTRNRKRSAGGGRTPRVVEPGVRRALRQLGTAERMAVVAGVRTSSVYAWLQTGGVPRTKFACRIARACAEACAAMPALGPAVTVEELDPDTADVAA